MIYTLLCAMFFTTRSMLFTKSIAPASSSCSHFSESICSILYKSLIVVRQNLFRGLRVSSNSFWTSDALQIIGRSLIFYTEPRKCLNVVTACYSAVSSIWSIPWVFVLMCFMLCVKLLNENSESLFPSIWVISLMFGFFSLFNRTDACLLYFFAFKILLLTPGLENYDALFTISSFPTYLKIKPFLGISDGKSFWKESLLSKIGFAAPNDTTDSWLYCLSLLFEFTLTIWFFKVLFFWGILGSFQTLLILLKFFFMYKLTFNIFYFEARYTFLLTASLTFTSEMFLFSLTFSFLFILSTKSLSS